MVRVRLREVLDFMSGTGTQGQTRFDRLIEEVLDIVPDARVLELLPCQSSVR